jgi:(+)-trans-carveol dehydrogenase
MAVGKFDGKVVLITGGARGQGRSHALHFAREGADVILTDICEQVPGVNYPLATKEDLDESVSQVEALGRRCLGYVADARDAVRMREVVDQAVGELGRLDVVAINHGIGAPHAPDDPAGWDIWDTVISTNLSAVFKTASVCIPHLCERGGSIIVTGSASSVVAIYNNPSYTAAKHGLLGLVKSLAADLSSNWIRVNAVLPTGVNTPLYVNEFNVGRFVPGNPDATIEDMKVPATALNQLPVPWIEAEDVSKAVLFLASDDAKYVTGIALPIDAGMTTQPPGISPYIGKLLWEAAQH